MYSGTSPEKPGRHWNVKEPGVDLSMEEVKFCPVGKLWRRGHPVTTHTALEAGSFGGTAAVLPHRHLAW